jgi:diadenosine tetraphosphatase ApaH/serine/threonine PP2A family protein phosphatase
MRIAVIADAHANLAALEAVLAALDALAPDRVLCLGDTVGYNAEPAACIDLVRERCEVVLAGNHDVDVATKRNSAGTNELARTVQQWTRASLDEDRLEYLATLPPRLIEKGTFTALHGSFLGGDPTLGYVTGTMLEENLHAVARSATAPIAFCGHSHVPLMGWLARGECHEQKILAGEPIVWPADAKAVLINPGAIGQPRDHDPRASFAIVDLDRRMATWHRVDYDIDRTVAAIRAAGLPRPLGERLREGR